MYRVNWLCLKVRRSKPAILATITVGCIITKIVTSYFPLDISLDNKKEHHDRTDRLVWGKPNEQEDLIGTAPGKDMPGQESSTPQSANSICKGISSPNPWSGETQTFQNVSSRPIYVFSAYLDHAFNDRSRPNVRVIAAGQQRMFHDIGDVHCILWYNDGGDVQGVPTGEVNYEVVYQSIATPDMYTVHFINCPVGKNKSLESKYPFAVSVVPSPCQQPTNYVTVLNVPYDHGYEEPQDFGLCVSPLYNHVNDVTLMFEFIEIHRALGVSRITFYDMGPVSMDGKVRELIDHYVSLGIVELINWVYPRSLDVNYFMQRVALNDCLYRNKLQVKYLAVSDLDEFMIPRAKDYSWEFLLSTIEKLNNKTKKKNIGAYLFQHAYFARTRPVQSKEPYFMTQTSFKRPSVPVPPGKIRCKTMYKVEAAYSVDIHFPYKLWPEYTEHIIHPKMALLHHYRNGPMKFPYEKGKRIEIVEDQIMTVFANRIKSEYEEYKRSIET